MKAIIRSFSGTWGATSLLGLLVAACGADAGSVASDDAAAEYSEALAACAPIACTAGTSCVRLHVVNTRNNGQNEACAFATSDIGPSSTFLAKYGYSLRFDPTADYENRPSNLLGDECTLQVSEANLVNYTNPAIPPPCDYDANDKARLALADSVAGSVLVFDAATRKPQWDATLGHWVFKEYSNHSWNNDAAINMTSPGQGLSFAHELGHYLHLPHTFVTDYTVASLKSGICSTASAQGLTLQKAYEKIADGDFPDVQDTAADPGTLVMADQCNSPVTQFLSVTCGSQTQQISMSPDRFDIMSYFQKRDCTGAQVPTLSAGQRARFARATQLGNRRQLLGFSAWVQSVPSLSKSNGFTNVVLADVTGGMSLRNVPAGQQESRLSIGFQHYPGDLIEDSIGTLAVGTQLNVFGRTSTGTIARKLWNGSAWTPADAKWENLGGTAAGKPVIVSMGGSDLDVFVRFTDNTIRHKALRNNQWLPAGTGWDNLGGSLRGDPAVASWGAGRMDIIARGSDNAIWRKVWTGSWWPSLTGWDNMGGQFTDSPAIISRAVNSLDMVARGTDGQLWYKAWTGAAWDPAIQTQWRSLGGSILGTPSITSWGASRLDIVARGSDNQVWRKVWTGSWWPSVTGWDPLGGSASKPPVVVAEAVDRLRYYSVGSDGNLYSRAWNGSAWLPSSGWTYLGRQ